MIIDGVQIPDHDARLWAAIDAEKTRREIEQGPFYWRKHARPEQIAPLLAADGQPWNTWLILAGRGFGKTRSGAEWVRENMCGGTPLARGNFQHMALIAETAADARDVMVGEGKGPKEASGILQVHPKDFCPVYEKSNRRLTWPNGAVATIYNATEPDQLRGPQHGAAWCDELAKWRYAQATWDQLQFGLRIGEQPRVMVSTTPKPIKLLREILNDPRTAITRGKTLDNSANLAASFIKKMMDRYAGTRLGRQELDAEILEDIPGALWSRAMIDAKRIKPLELPDLARIVVAIDPAVSTNEGSDETGIIVAGIDHQSPPHVYVLDDLTLRGTPMEWAKAAVQAFHIRRADRIVAEVNNGGDMVETTVRSVDPNASYKAVHASKGKFIRAEPVSALYEQGRVHHVGSFPDLEDQMTTFTADFDRKANGYSPDRMDALVWAISELAVVTVEGWGILEYYAQLERATNKEQQQSQARPAVATIDNGGVRLRMPPGAQFSTVYGYSGKSYTVTAGEVIADPGDDADNLIGQGWQRV